jgi:D-sedoheptulose 7-phosphate isomerase
MTTRDKSDMKTETDAIKIRIVLRLEELADAARQTADVLSAEIADAVKLVRDTLAQGGTLYFCGNGGSAADAQHIATEYVVRYMARRKPLRAIALTTDTSLLTAAGNDLGFEEVFARQVEALLTPRDLLVIHSTSGSSPNVLRAAEAAHAAGARVLALTSLAGGRLRALADRCLVVPVDRSDRAQELHLCIEHVICELVEEQAT